MKTRQNHRKTTTSRRRRRVVKQQRVQTRIHRRKGTTVSSGRRHHFFKRGGNGTYKDGIVTKSVRVASFQQNQDDRQKREKDAADDQARIDAQKAATLDYPDVDKFVEGINPTNTNIHMEINLLKFSILKLSQKIFESSDVQNGNKQIPVTIKIDGKTVTFYISHIGCDFYIYVNNTLYGQLQITAPNGIVIATDTICRLVPQIKLDLINSSKLIPN
jgi:hypothetical protein